MRVLFYDCFSGISGDMNLGAMLALGIKKDDLINELNKLNLKGWKLIIEQDQRHGISGTKVTVVLSKEDKIHRHLSDIEGIINSSTLDQTIKSLSLDIFMKVAVAEAKVHNINVNEVHFHEVGAIDSIIDIVGAAICFHLLKVEKVVVSPVELGGGFVKCAHGILPVPAPATVEILKNIPVRQGGVNFEATTPTGAAIVSTIGDEFTAKSLASFNETGYGIGHKENPELPNLLRVHIGELKEEGTQGLTSYLIECNIDDMNPEWYDSLMQKLFAAGAADVYLTSIIMKKGRPGTKVSLICHPDHIDSIKDTLFIESSTLGIRIFPFEKHTLEREFKRLNTPLGEVMVKYSYYKGETVSAKPEHEDCIRIAEENNLPLRDIYKKILKYIDEEVD
jgi:uncharacterized protein (TIGR00299 family) protein